MARKKLENIRVREQSITIEAYINNQKRAGALNLSHPLQRESQQWSTLEKSNFIRRLCWHEPVPRLYIVEIVTEDGKVIPFLIDGKQRITTIFSFVNNEFAISKKTRNTVITYEKTLYETEKIIKNGKEVEVEKLDEYGKKIPVLDENGIIQSVVVDYDIAGKKFKQLPEELQWKFLHYHLSADIKTEGTNEDIQNDILDYNSGKPMNAAQIGVNLLGINWATQINQLTKHDFISDNTGFTLKDFNRDMVHASISEALMLMNFPNEWRSGAKDIGAFLGGHLEQEYIDEFREMMDELHNELPDDDEIVKDNFKSKEFFIIMANFAHYRQAHNGSTQTYVKFLDRWFSEYMYRNSSELTGENILLSKEEEPVSYAEFSDERRSKSSNIVMAKLAYMNEIMDRWISEHEDDELFEDEEEDTEELYNISDQDAAIIAALRYSLPEGLVTEELIHQVKKDLVNMPDDDREDYLSNGIMYGGEATKLLQENVDVDHSDFDNPMNAAALACVIKEIREDNSENYNRMLPIIEGWLKDFSTKWEDSYFGQKIKDNDILGKQGYMQKSIEDFAEGVEE